MFIIKHFMSFYFRGCGLIREIRENKTLAKISTYTVLDSYSTLQLQTAKSCNCEINVTLLHIIPLPLF
jgi:hypothetical protein